MAKLTLYIPDELVLLVKEEAAARKTSVSKLVTSYFKTLSGDQEEEEGELTADLSPRTARLAGSLSEADKEDYIDYLEKKHS